MTKTERPASLVPPDTSSIDTLMRTKFFRPRVSSDVISRDRFFQRLNTGLEDRVTLVCAPAGFGKTTLLVKWLESIDRASAWISLDERDNDLSVFVHAIASSVQTVFPDACQNTASLLKARQLPLTYQLATLIINDLADLPQDVILVLDDYHLIHASEIHNLLNLLIEHLPPQLHLVLTARSDPPLSLSRWRAKGYLHDLRGTDLRFTLSDIEAFLARMLENEVIQATASELEEVTEGWIALLRLVTLSLSKVTDPEVFIERLRNSPEESVSGYLVEEVLSQQSHAVQELLMRMSILEQFSVDMCDAVMGSDATHEQVRATVDWLQRSNVFLVPLDDIQGWYRYHHLFRMLLQQRLFKSISSGELAILHQRASTWYAEHGFIEGALKHALEAGDVSAAVCLVEAQFLPLREQERWGLMERWLRLLPEEEIQRSPTLLCARVWIMQTHGQHRDLPHLLTAIEHLLATNSEYARDEGDRQFRLLHALVENAWGHCYYRLGQAQSSLEHARSALSWLPPGEEQGEIFALMYLALSSQLAGQEEVALMELDKGLRSHAQHLVSIARLLTAQGLVYLAAGKLLQAEQTARHLQQIAREGKLTLSQNYAHWLLGVVHYERNLLDEAMYHFTFVISHQHLVNFWAVQDAMFGLALTYQAQGSDKKAWEEADAMLCWVQGQHNIEELKVAYAFCAQVALLQDDVEKATQLFELACEQEVLCPMRFLEDPPLTKAHVLLAQGDTVGVTHAQGLLDDLMGKAQAIHNTRKTIKAFILQAWAYELQGSADEALDVLERALALGRTGGYVRVFADLPKLARLLEKLRKRRKTLQIVDNKFDAYLQEILSAMIPLTPSSTSKERLMLQEGLEPLTKRELHILRLLDKGLTNKEIARELVVTTGTVKVHTKNIYRKLNVNNRQAAVSLAKPLGLLGED